MSGAIVARLTLLLLLLLRKREAATAAAAAVRTYEQLLMMKTAWDRQRLMCGNVWHVEPSHGGGLAQAWPVSGRFVCMHVRPNRVGFRMVGTS
eukprot:364283-Chlamydomonas_euryale.AAC.27